MKSPNVTNQVINEQKTFYLLLTLGILIGVAFYIFLPQIDVTGYRKAWTDRSMDRGSLYLLVLFIILIGPIIEELAFRLHLTKNKKLQNIGLLFYICFGIISFHSQLLMMVFWIPSAALLYLVTKKYMQRENFLLPSLLVSSTMFSTMHIINAEVSLFSLIALMIYFMAGGVLLGIIRIKKGILFSILFHCIFNLIMVYFNELSPENDEQKINCGSIQIAFQEKSILSDEDFIIKVEHGNLMVENGNLIKVFELYYPSAPIESYRQTRSFINYDVTATNFSLDLQYGNQLLECFADVGLLTKK